MHVSGKKMAFCGLTLALTVILIVLSGVLDFNTLFLLGAASFLIGIIIRECGLRLGAAFYVASVLLGFILAPNKLYCITFAAMGFYVVGVEFIWRRLGLAGPGTNRKVVFWISKYVLYNLMYLPMLFLLPELLFPGNFSKGLLLAAIAVGQAVLFVYDRAYEYFLNSVWGSFRKRIRLDL